MANTFKIHPAIGIARLGNSPDEIYLSPEEPGALPVKCDADGNPALDKDGQEVRDRQFKDSQGRVKRQAARFRVYVYDEQSPDGREVKIGDEIEVAALQPLVGAPSGQILRGTLVDIAWTVYLANKKSVWYHFKELEGEHGYTKKHPLRNAGITEKHLRQQLIIDPGPQTVSSVGGSNGPNSAEFAKGQNPNNAQTFPPPLEPASITTLGEIKANVQQGYGRLIVLGGYGNSGSAQTGLGQPVIEHYANNDGWFDDTSDGPVTATLLIQVTSIDGRPVAPSTPPQTATYAVDEGAWVIVGYPRFAPQIVDVVTMDDLVYDVAVRQFADDINMYGVSPFHGTQKRPDEQELPVWREQAIWNTNYYPFFWRDIWPILQRPNNYQWVMSFDGGDPHNSTRGANGNMDPDWLSMAPYAGEPALEREQRRQRRQFIYKILRQPGMENQLTIAPFPGQPKNLPKAMPFLCGDNPLTNTAAAKFLRLTDTQLFLLRQWADGKFVNEQADPLAAPAAHAGDTAARSGRSIDRGVLSNLLGGAFCPGGEAAWIMRNPAIYSSAYCINQSTIYTPGSLSQKGDLANGLEPGDITKYSAQPWQSDFNECSTNVTDITYEDWNKIQPKSTGDPVKQQVQLTYWWPAHRPMQVALPGIPPAGGTVTWTQGIPQSKTGDLMMVTAWSGLGFIIDYPEYTPENGAAQYVLVEAAPNT